MFTRQMTSLRGLLTQHPLKASAPCRIDSGGTWDIKAMALPLQMVEPTTVNIALNLRTFVTLLPYLDGSVSISSQGFPLAESFPSRKVPFDSPFGLFFAALSYFGFHGLKVDISSQSPVKSALGGSSTALVALLKALVKASVRLGGKELAGDEILHLAYNLEDSVCDGKCGLQDQAAAVYGGVHQWKWRYGDGTPSVERHPLLDRGGQKELSRRFLVAYGGIGHNSLLTNRDWIRDFLSGRTRAGWIEANEIVHHLARSIEDRKWDMAADLLRRELAVRRKITPDALIPITRTLADQAESVGCGARFAGAGAGGSIWALGEIDNIRRLRELWEVSLAPIKDAEILSCEVDPEGME